MYLTVVCGKVCCGLRCLGPGWLTVDESLIYFCFNLFVDVLLSGVEGASQQANDVGLPRTTSAPDATATWNTSTATKQALSTSRRFEVTLAVFAAHVEDHIGMLNRRHVLQRR